MSASLLLIEDDIEINATVKEILELAGYNVHTAKNGIEGIRIAQKELPDLIICDIMMPEMDGYGVIYSLAQNPELAHIPFIFLTAKAENEDLRKGMRMGADDYLTKPFEVTELLLSIEARLKKSALIKKKYTTDFKGLENLVEDAKPITNLDSILNESITVTGEKKDVLYREGSYPSKIYYIKKGRVKTIKLHEDGKEMIVEIFKEGEFFGVVAAMTNTEYHHAAICLEDYEIATISLDDFSEILKSNSQVAGKMLKILSGDVQSKEIELLEIAYGTVRSRVVDAILKLSEKYSDEIDSGLPLSREEMAQYVGIATETLIRTISDFKDEELIITKGRRIVPNFEKLETFKY